jgi:hypothetical protein
VKKQRATGKTKMGNTFPLSVLVQPLEKSGVAPTVDRLSSQAAKKSFSRVEDASIAATAGTPNREANFSLMTNGEKLRMKFLKHNAFICSPMLFFAASEKDLFRGVVWVFANISGLITVLPDGTIHSINDNFALLLFGYRKEELLGCVSDCIS